MRRPWRSRKVAFSGVSSLITSWWLPLSAHASGVLPKRVFMSRSAPALSSMFTTPACPLSAATCSAQWPCGVVASRSARFPGESRSGLRSIEATTAVSPDEAACKKRSDMVRKNEATPDGQRRSSVA